MYFQNFSNNHFFSKSSLDEVQTGDNFNNTSCMIFPKDVALPTQTTEPIKKPDQILSKDVNFLGSSNSKFEDAVHKSMKTEKVTRKEGGTKKATCRPNKKRTRWTPEEHQ